MNKLFSAKLFFLQIGFLVVLGCANQFEFEPYRIIPESAIRYTDSLEIHATLIDSNFTFENEKQIEMNGHIDNLPKLSFYLVNVSSLPMLINWSNSVARLYERKGSEKIGIIFGNDSYIINERITNTGLRWAYCDTCFVLLNPNDSLYYEKPLDFVDIFSSRSLSEIEGPYWMQVVYKNYLFPNYKEHNVWIGEIFSDTIWIE